MEFRNHRTKKPKKEMNCSSLLPTEINLDIFSRLSFDNILECKRVCKNWQSPLVDPCFPRMHLRRSRFQLDDENGQGNSYYRFSRMSFLFACLGKREDMYIYGEYDEIDGQKSNMSITKSKPIPNIMGGTCLGSCDGLIVCQPRIFPTDDVQSMDRYVSLVVSNPMTREYVNLPKFNEPYRHRFMMFGFGYDSSTNVYKVVRIFYPSHQNTHDGGGSFVGQIYVYTLGCRGRGWRQAGNIDHHLNEDPGVLANGSLHWLEKNKNRIFAFDLADEKFREIAAPPGLDLSYNQSTQFSLRVLGGWLCIHHKLNRAFFTTDIWVLKKNTIGNSSCDIIGITENQHEAWSWTKEFSMDGYSQPYTTYLYPLAITKKGQLLLLQDKCILTRDEYRRLSISHYNAGLSRELLSDNFFQQSLVRCNPKIEALEKICDTVMQLHGVGFPFIKSFVSLKDLGEKEANKI